MARLTFSPSGGHIPFYCYFIVHCACFLTGYSPPLSQGVSEGYIFPVSLDVPCGRYYHMCGTPKIPDSDMPIFGTSLHVLGPAGEWVDANIDIVSPGAVAECWS
ncbi:hypothetical protein L208DRAFT_1411349, partial [Tricholoma matsutake]